MLGTPLTKIHAKTSLLDGAHELMNDVRSGHLGKESPLSKIRAETAEVSHLGAEAFKGFIGL